MKTENKSFVFAVGSGHSIQKYMDKKYVKKDVLEIYRNLLCLLRYDVILNGDFIKTLEYPSNGWIEFSSDILTEIETLTTLLT